MVAVEHRCGPGTRGFMTVATRARVPRAVIFDFDGVILESANIKTEAFLALFAHYPEHRDAIREYHVRNVGISRFRKFQWIYAELLKTPLGEAESTRLGDAFSRIVLEEILKCPFVPGARELLKDLRCQSRLFVASGTPQDELEHIIEQRGLAPYFTEVWGTPALKADILSSILSRHEIPRDEVVFIGDGESDYSAAKQTGIPFIGRDCPFGGSRWMEMNVDSVPDLVLIRSMLGLPEREET